MYTVSITSQGQVSIPAPIRKALGLNKKSKAIASILEGKMILEPVEDFLSLAGVFSKYAKKGLSESQILKMENDAIDEAKFERYLRKEKSSGNKIVKIK